MTRSLLLLVLSTLACPALAWSQNTQDVLKQGEQVFNLRCATGYCHGARGTPAGAPRLAARGFDQLFISDTVSHGVPGTAMSAFDKILSPAELMAVVAYVASLNGIANSNLNVGQAPAQPPGPPLSPEAARGRDLFSDSFRGFRRCSTCHEFNGIGIPVATPIATVPADVQALRALATPQVATAAFGGETMPALIVRKGTRPVIFYDLTIPPPVLRTVDSGTVDFSEGSAWKHSSVIESYGDADLASILAFLREVVKH
ncbi:MAG: cytochrome c [Candidatus Acidiferrales bacterium]|jgi:mono/diheme cytochrome c family protein